MRLITEQVFFIPSSNYKGGTEFSLRLDNRKSLYYKISKSFECSKSNKENQVQDIKSNYFTSFLQTEAIISKWV